MHQSYINDRSCRFNFDEVGIPFSSQFFVDYPYAFCEHSVKSFVICHQARILFREMRNCFDSIMWDVRG